MTGPADLTHLEQLAHDIGQFQLCAGHRGLPLGLAKIDSTKISALNWRPADGKMNLPLLTVSTLVYEDNKQTMLDLCRSQACAIAPHIKTPMSPVIARDMVDSGTWGISVADLRQASVMLGHGLNRILIANEIGGKAAAERLANLLAQYPKVEVFLFIDSVELLDGLKSEWLRNPALPVLKLLIEIGCGRGGISDNSALRNLLDAMPTEPDARIMLAGIASYEGTVNSSDQTLLAASLDELFGRISSALKLVREKLGHGPRLILSAGGSSLFDHVIVRSNPILKQDGNAFLLLRSGACFFSDHGLIRERLQAIAGRGLLGPEASERAKGSFKPALRLWSEVLSVTDDRRAICGFGMRDVAHDQGVPVPIALWRGGIKVSDLDATTRVAKLNDQHAFLESQDLKLRVGDVVELGIRHPCTTLDKHDLIYALNAAGQVKAVLRTYFG